MKPLYRFATAGLTHEGLVRSANEDSHLLRDDLGLWAVADGMGGHENGQWASRTIVERLAAVPASGDFETDLDSVRGAVAEANAVIRERAEAAGKAMGSTLALLMAAGSRYACVWAGDSRVYRLRDGVLEQLSRDHTQVQDLIDKGLLTPEQARDHPMGHVLSRAIGVEDPVRLDTLEGTLDGRDVFLLCSDGLTGVVSHAEIEDHLKTSDPRSAGRRLIELTLSRGAPDNVTLVTVACEEMTALTIAGDA
jgi:serine/threonine protein phosphatase PrpC